MWFLSGCQSRLICKTGAAGYFAGSMMECDSLDQRVIDAIKEAIRQWRVGLLTRMDLKRVILKTIYLADIP